MAVVSNDIDRQAAEWAARADERLSGAERAELDAWLAADARHLGAYAKASAVLVQVERMRATSAHSDYVLPRPAPSRRSLMFGGAMAAGLAAVTLATTFAWPYLQQQTYATGFGESRVVALDDGSVVTLNTDSKVVVRYSSSRRDVTLVHGEALFDVAKNKARPFVVAVRDVAVRAVGTSFAVRSLEGEPVHVVVREGVVELKRPETPVAPPVMLKAGGLAVIPANAPIGVRLLSAGAIDHELAWKGGRIAFEDETLIAAAREFSRYSTTRIVINDPETAQRTVTGLFVANDPIGFARAVALSLELEADIRQNEVRLVPKKR
jgi:transmembrane sensor